MTVSSRQPCVTRPGFLESGFFLIRLIGQEEPRVHEPPPQAEIRARRSSERRLFLPASRITASRIDPPPFLVDDRRQGRFFPAPGGLARLPRPCLGGPPFDAPLTVALVLLAPALLFGGSPFPLGDPFGLGAPLLLLQRLVVPVAGRCLFLPFLVLAE